MNDLFLKALRCENHSRPPVWLMRQAGRYMPKYRQLREKYSFLEMCHTPELISKVTRLPIDEFGMDAAILFSDILVIPEAFDRGLRFDEKKGPIIERPIIKINDIESLKTIDVKESLKYVSDGIQLLQDLNVPLIGFSGGPFTVASYMIEGGSSRDLKKTKQWMIREPESFHLLLEKITKSTIDYLNLQIESNVDALQIFDSWANYLSYDHFQEFSLKYLEKILIGIQRKIPTLIFCKGSSLFASEIAKIKPSGISLDAQGDLKKLREDIDRKIAIQGNLDPDVLYGDKETIRRETKKILDKMKGESGFIFNLGHGILPDMTEDSVRILVETVKNYEAN